MGRIGILLPSLATDIFTHQPLFVQRRGLMRRGLSRKGDICFNGSFNNFATFILEISDDSGIILCDSYKLVVGLCCLLF